MTFIMTTTTSEHSSSSSDYSSDTDMQRVRDQIVSMVCREDRTYRCIDYMAHERNAAVGCVGNTVAMYNLVEECAHVVHDRSLQNSSPTNSNSNTTNSTNGVSKVASTVSLRDVQEVNNNINNEPNDAQNQNNNDTPSQQTFTFWRQQMFDWACMVVDGYGLERDSVAISFNLLDRFIVLESSKPSCDALPITRDDYQLFSMTCLYIAIKIVETVHKKLPVQTLVDMSKNYYTKEVIEATERDILKALNWQVHAPTGLSYARLLAQLFPTLAASRHMEATALTLTEIAVADSFFVACRPSVVGMAAILHAARLEGLSDSCIHQFHVNLQGLIPTRTCLEFRMVYLQLEKLYFH